MGDTSGIDTFARHKDELDHPTDFADYRNRLGDLLLVPKKFNASYDGEPYAAKLKYYVEHDMLSKSLHQQGYKHNPGFNRFLKESQLRMQPHDDFKNADLDARQTLYRQIAERIWSPAWLDRIATGEVAIS